MPGGFHPFHAGHAALYNSIRRAFPGAEVYVAATNDTSTRPFPFAVKEKLAKLAGVEPGHFVQVKSPFRAEEITSQFDPTQDQLIFVRSEKDSDKQPLPGGVKKNGEPAYLQPFSGAKKLQPFSKHAYMAYLPTVEFGPGMTSATEIRSAWPTLNEKRKTALVMALYPKTQGNAKLAATVVKLLDTAIQGIEGLTEFAPSQGRDNDDDILFNYARMFFNAGDDTDKQDQIADLLFRSGWEIGWDEGYEPEPGVFVVRAGDVNGNSYISWSPQDLQGFNENQGWAATYNEQSRSYDGQQGAGMWAGYQQRENQPVDEDYVEEKWSQKYKRSINCANPRGFSQRAHCQGRKK